MERILIIGAGQAGAQAAASLRQVGFEGEVALIGEEPAPPYQRPPLSKAYLMGDLAVERLFLKPEKFYADNAITLMTGRRAIKIDRAVKQVALQTGQDGAVEEIAYDKLLFATGAPPRRLPLPGTDLKGVHYLRTLADSDWLRPILSQAGRVVIVGAGYIGLEVAAVARKAGREVTIIERAERPLARVAGPELGGFFEKLHRDAGVEFRLSAALEGFDEKDGHVCAARLSDETIPCGAALIGVGAAPATSLAAEAGLEIDDSPIGGIMVDETAVTSDPAIWAAGDCANFPSPFFGRRMRLESVPNAIEQSKVAAANMARRDDEKDLAKIYDALPWFWSDQYDVKLQSAGLAEGADEVVVRGIPGGDQASGHSFSVWSLKDGAPIAVDAVSDPVSFAMGRRLIPLRQRVEAKKLADPEFDLKSLLS